MKSIFALLLVGFGLIYLLRTDITPYRLVTQQELRDIATAAANSATRANSVSASSSGRWMFDPTYRTSLEKTTIIGVPEHSKYRER